MSQRNLQRLLPANCLQQNKRFLLVKKKLLLVCGLQGNGKHICEADVSLCRQTSKLWQRCWATKAFIGREWVSPAGLLLFTAQVLWVRLSISSASACFFPSHFGCRSWNGSSNICCHVVTSSCWFSLCLFDLTWTVCFALTNTKCFVCRNQITYTLLQHP